MFVQEDTHRVNSRHPTVVHDGATDAHNVTLKPRSYNVLRQGRKSLPCKPDVHIVSPSQPSEINVFPSSGARRNRQKIAKRVETGVDGTGRAEGGGGGGEGGGGEKQVGGRGGGGGSRR